MDPTYWCKAHYLDASALVKLVADDPSEEPGRRVLRRYYWQHVASMYATSYCITEAFSAFKRKFLRAQITEDQYIKYVQTFIRQFLGANLRQDDVPILSAVVFSEAERLIKKHKIDFLDCFQIVTIMHGRFHVLGPNSQSILVTADRGLAKAASAEGARVWECTSELAPDQVLASTVDDREASHS
jgi:predicted nucleic acid-binding protein